MDVAQELEASLMLRRKPANEAMERGESDIQQFYKDSVVFLTGASGFLGKQFMEKLLRSCDIKTLYVLLRPKRGKTMHERLSMLLSEPVYDILRQNRPGFSEKIVAVEGDINELGLGISNDDWRTITSEVRNPKNDTIISMKIDMNNVASVALQINVIVHMAATTRFNEPLRVATITNVRSTREVIRLGRDCTNLRSLVHLSTAFANATRSRINQEVLEQFYPSPMPPQALIELAEQLDDRLEDATPGLLKDYENTYVFTKAVAEEAVREMAGDLPVCIVRPPIVMSSYFEPTPGWIDKSAIFGPIGIMLGVGTGTLHVVLNKNANFNIAPVDYVNNAVIAAGWDVAMRRSYGETETPIYTLSSMSHDLSMNAFSENMRKKEFQNIMTPKAIWLCYAFETGNDFMYWLLTWLLHYIPAYIVDGVCFMLGIKLKDIPSAVKLYTKIYNTTKILSYFMSNEWNFKDDKCRELFTRLSPTDKQIYNFDTTTIDMEEMVPAYYIGLRRYTIKDGLKGSAYGKKKQQYFRIANYVFMSLYFYVIWKILYFLYTMVLYIF